MLPNTNSLIPSCARRRTGLSRRDNRQTHPSDNIALSAPSLLRRSDEASCQIGHVLLPIPPKTGSLAKITSEITGYFG